MSAEVLRACLGLCVACFSLPGLLPPPFWVFLFNLAFGLFFETFASRVLAVEVLTHFVLPWKHRARWPPNCGCFCVDGRQANSDGARPARSIY